MDFERDIWYVYVRKLLSLLIDHIDNRGHQIVVIMTWSWCRRYWRRICCHLLVYDQSADLQIDLLRIRVKSKCPYLQRWTVIAFKKTTIIFIGDVCPPLENVPNRLITYAIFNYNIDTMITIVKLMCWYSFPFILMQNCIESWLICS